MKVRFGEPQSGESQSSGPLFPDIRPLNPIKAIDILVTKIHEISTSQKTDASDEERNMLPFYTRKVLIEEALTLRAIAQDGFQNALIG